LLVLVVSTKITSEPTNQSFKKELPQTSCMMETDLLQEHYS
jgi:hypothetical protein